MVGSGDHMEVSQLEWCLFEGPFIVWLVVFPSPYWGPLVLANYHMF